MSTLPIKPRPALFFMHIPKTAGSSMRLFLRNQYGFDELYPHQDWRTVRSVEDVARYRLVQGHFRYNFRQVVAPRAKVLTVLRDPLRRTLSSLRHLRRDPNFAPEHELAAGMTTRQMIRAPEIMRSQRNVQAAYLCASAAPEAVLAHLAARPGADAAAMEGAPTAELALRRLEEIECLAVTDELVGCVADISEQLEFHPVARLPEVNQDPDRRDPLAEIDADEMAILRAHNELDILLFERAKVILRQRRFEAAMRRLLAGGVYAVPPASFEVDLASPIPGCGWHPPEQRGALSWRWTGPTDEFTLELPLRHDAAYELVMRFNRPAALGDADVAVVVNGNAMARTLTRNKDAYTLVVRIPQPLLARSDGLCRIVFTAAAVAAPGDGRLLGVAVDRLAFNHLP